MSSTLDLSLEMIAGFYPVFIHNEINTKFTAV